MATGQRTTYTDTAPQKRALSEMIGMIDWTEAPLLKKFGINNESKFRLVNWPRTKVEWLEDTMSPRSTTLASNYTAGGGTIAVAAGTGQYFKTGDILRIENELMYVTSVSTDTITVVTAFGGTTNANHSSGVAVQLATVARLEGANTTTGHTTTLSNPYNHTQILAEGVQVAGSEAVDTKYSIEDTEAYQIAKLMGDGGKAGKLPILLQQTFYHGKRAAGSDTTARAMGGFEYYVTANTALGGAALTRKVIEDAMQVAVEAGGRPDTLVVGGWGRRKITSFYEGFITTERSEERGGASITTVVTDFGEIEVCYDRWMPAVSTSSVYIVDSTKLGWVEYRPFDVVERASIGDYTLKDVIGEYSFVLMNPAAHAIISGMSLTS